MRIDLHTHTVASDGLLDAAQLIRLAGEAGVGVLAVTDHDSTESVEAAMRSGREAGIDVVPAVELNTDVPGAEVHILGYFIDHRLEWLQALLRRLRDGRLHRAERMGEKLAALGVPIEMERVLAFAGGGAVGRPHVARALVEAGYVTETAEAFTKYIGRNGPAYVERLKVTPAQAVEGIRRPWGRPTGKSGGASTCWSPAAQTSTAGIWPPGCRWGASTCRPRWWIACAPGQMGAGLNPRRPHLSSRRSRKVHVATSQDSRLRQLPSVERVLQQLEAGGHLNGIPRPLAARAVRQVVEGARRRLIDETAPAEWAPALVIEESTRAVAWSGHSRLTRAVNATGIIIHTNLGRAPLSQAAQEAVRAALAGYTLLEIDPETGDRGSRHTHVER